MAEKEKKSGPQTAMEAAGSIKQAAKLAADVGRVFAGDMSAIKDVLANKLFWEILLVIALIVAMTSMLIGAAITGVVQFIAASWSENWEENMLDQAIGSNGNATMYKNFGWLFALDDTVSDVISDAFEALTRASIQAGADGSDNSQLAAQDKEAYDAGRNPTENDYATTMQAIKNNIALNTALTDRLEMIQGRVMQRGIQIKNAAIKQYITGRKSEYNKIAKELSKKMEEKMESNANDVIVLYAGFNEELSEENFNIDLSAFELTELQALKILAIFSIQHDCQLTEMDMWTLMDYCGWYVDKITGELEDVPDSIYETVLQDQRYGNDIGSVTEENMGIPIATYEFKPLQVPVWTGTCAPQWYYEELAKIREHNRQYLDQLYRGEMPDNMIPWGINAPSLTSGSFTIPGTAIPSEYQSEGLFGTKYLHYYVVSVTNKDRSTTYEISRPAAGQDLLIDRLFEGCKYVFRISEFKSQIKKDGSLGERVRVSSKEYATYDVPPNLTAEEADTAIDTSQFEKLSSIEPYGLIDRLFYSAENHLTVKRNEYSSTQDWTRSDIEALGDTDIYKFWEKYIWAQENATNKGIVRRDDNGKHSFTYTDGIPSASTYITKLDQYGNILQYRYTTYSISLYRTESSGWLGTRETYVSTVYSSSDKTFRNLSGDTTYRLYLDSSNIYIDYTYTYDEEGNITSTTTSRSYDYGSTRVGSFTTFEDQLETEAYELYVSIDISFKARSVDEIAFDLLGIWPSSLDKLTQVVRTTQQGNLVGKTENDQYSYCFKGATISMDEIARVVGLTQEELEFWNGLLLPNSFYFPTARANSTISVDLPMTTTTYIFEYGLHSSPGLKNANDTPLSGWKAVAANEKPVVFDGISGDANYLVYMRITEVVEVLNADGSHSRTEQKYLFKVDEIRPGADTPVEDGVYYADGHLGNENMLLNWTDTYTAPNGTTQTIEMTRMSGYQYESYVDMVMALCELLDIPYSDWDPAIQRAIEFGWSVE